MLLLPHRFRPPKKTDEKGWQVVKFLLEHGFYFQHLYEERSSDQANKPFTAYAPYPKNLREAKEFIETYKEQARQRSNVKLPDNDNQLQVSALRLLFVCWVFAPRSRNRRG